MHRPGLVVAQRDWGPSCSFSDRGQRLVHQKRPGEPFRVFIFFWTPIVGGGDQNACAGPAQPGVQAEHSLLPSLSACPSSPPHSILRVDRFPAKPCEELFRIGFHGEAPHIEPLAIAAEGVTPRGDDKSFPLSRNPSSATPVKTRAGGQDTINGTYLRK